jgi:leucyl aminopeptidase
MNINFKNISNLTILPKCTCLIFDENKTMSVEMLELDKRYNNIISNSLKDAEFFSGKYGQMKNLTIQEEGAIKTIVLIGLGDESKIDKIKIEDIGAKIACYAVRIKVTEVSICIYNKINNVEKDELAACLAFGAELGGYNFDKYKSVKAEKLKELSIMLDSEIVADKIYNSYYKSIIKGIEVARDVVNEPSNILYPESYAAIISQHFSGTKVKVKILGESAMEELGMNALLGVGKGSAKESKLVIMEYHGKGDDSAPVALVGKGVTFDTGGICIKPSNGMWRMKYDMAGSASVFGVIKTLSLRGAKVNAIGVIALVENMPGGNAQNPGDIVKTMSGQTVEVLDTDAEGRLILADALWYAQKNYNPQIMIDLATLTGAISVALGSNYGGLFSNNSKLTEQLIASGKTTGEQLWHMPMCQDFTDMMKSDWADLANISNQRGLAGSSTAAAFLEKFTNNITWAHLDIAGMAWQDTAKNIVNPKGATGFGVKLLNQLIKDYYE